MDEKRKLSPFPSFSSKKLWAGDYTDSIDLYYADNFVFRSKLIGLASRFNQSKGFKFDDISYYHLDRIHTAETVDSSALLAKKRDSANNVIPDMPYEKISGVVVCNKRALQSFWGNKYAALRNAKMMRAYKQVLGPKVNIISMAVPVGADFFLPAKINKLKEIEFINQLYEAMDSNIVCVRAYEEIKKHKDEYIQFNTDHHWTGRGAYYAYVAFCNAMGFKCLPLSSYNRTVIPNFLGTLYYDTRSEELKENIDSVECFRVPNKTSCTLYEKDLKYGVPYSLYVDFAKGSNAYGVFLGGDFPLIHVKSDVKNGRRIAVFKDSYGNAFSPYLASSFEEVFILDFRYFEANIKTFVEEHHITDVMFAQNVFNMNYDVAMDREESFLTYIPPEKRPKKEGEKKEK